MLLGFIVSAEKVFFYISGISGLLSFFFLWQKFIYRNRISTSFNQIHLLPIPDRELFNLYKSKIINDFCNDRKFGNQENFTNQKILDYLRPFSSLKDKPDELFDKIDSSLIVRLALGTINNSHPKTLAELYILTEDELRSISSLSNTIFTLIMPISFANDGLFSKSVEAIHLKIADSENNEVIYRARYILNDADYYSLIVRNKHYSEMQLMPFYSIPVRPMSDKTVFALFEFNFESPGKWGTALTEGIEYQVKLELIGVNGEILNDTPLKTLKIKNIIPVWKGNTISIPLDHT